MNDLPTIKNTHKYHYNICVIRPIDYIHAHAFDELSELIYYALLEKKERSDKMSEVKITKVDNEIVRTATNIIIGGHLLAADQLRNLPKHVIIFNTEQMDACPHDWKINVLALATKYPVWDYSITNITFFRNYGITNIWYFKFGYQKELDRKWPKEEKEIDVLLYGSINNRRLKILIELRDKGLNVVNLFGVYGEERDAYIRKSKIVLNMHYYDTFIFEIVRVFYLVTNGVMVVSEINKATSIDPRYENLVIGAKYEDLVETCVTYCALDHSKDNDDKYGHHLRTLLAAIPQSENLPLIH